MSKKRLVKQIDFTGEGHHVALVPKAANGESVLLMKNKVDIQKAEEVKITTSMQTFLSTFFRMWEEDAQELAVLLGYEPQEWYWDMVGEDTTVEIMKSAVEDPSENLIHKETYENLKKCRLEFNKLKKAYDADKKEKEEIMSKDNVDVTAELEKQKTEMAELKKALEAKDTELTELKKAAEKKEKDELVDICKGYSFVEDADKLAETLFLCKSVQGGGIILDTLEKARKAIKAALEKEVGTDEEKPTKTEVPDNISKTAEIIKSMRKEGK